MVEVYFYMPALAVENAVECGIKLSDWYSREVNLDGENRKCIAALFNPRDDYARYTSPDYKCLKLEVQPKYCFAAESLLYGTGLVYPEVMELYRRSVVPADRYTFGTYRLPECLITCTVIGEYVKVLGRGLDTPVLYNNSQELYFSNLIEGFKDTHEDFNDAILYNLLKRLCEDGKFKVVEDRASGLAVFEDTRDGRIYTLRIPDMERY